ncbi:MAG: ABC transporter substrate-binding protein [Myxococcota bacterium]|jgi:ABC-type branched-subunit amino acid transport system substrate-binding protein|nr:ABC transporter substrate-binding protein [Myxococcota bacterium]
MINRTHLATAPARLPLSVASLLALVATLPLGCSLALDFTECSSNAECQALTAEPTPLICGAQNTCIPRECEKGADCATKGTGLSCVEGVCVPSTDDSCDDHARCINDFGPTWLCSTQKRCIQAITTECSSLELPQGDPSQLIVIGSLLPLSAFDTESALASQRAIELAVDDFNTANVLGGKKIALLRCDAGSQDEQAERAARHLYESLGVQLVLSPLPAELLEASTPLGWVTGALSITSTTSPSRIGLLEDNGLLWRDIPSDAFQANAIADRIADAQRSSVLLLARNDLYGNGLLDAVSQRLVQRGVATPTLLRYPAPDSFSDLASREAEYLSLAQGLHQSHPSAELVVILGGAEATELLVAIARQREPELTGIDQPDYLLSHEAVDALPAAIKGSSDKLAVFVEVIGPERADAQNFAAFATRYRSLFGAEPHAVAAPGYDACMLGLLAHCASPGDLRGSALASTLARLNDKAAQATAISFGSAGFVQTACDTLASSRNIDVRGVSGPLDLDPSSAELRGDYLSWVVKRQGASYLLSATDRYRLDTAPATDGQWEALNP